MTRRRRAIAAWMIALASMPALAQSPTAPAGAASEKWITTWATATVGRPQSVPVPAGPAAAAVVHAPQPSVPPPANLPASPPAASSAAAPSSPPAAAAPARTAPPPIQFSDQTLRQIVRVSIGGDRVRVVLSNRFGTAALSVGSAHVSLREREAAIVAASSQPLTFSGRRKAMIPAGAILVSDPVTLTVPSQSDLAIDLYLPVDTARSPSPLTMHGNAVQTSYVSTPGDHAGAATLPVAATIQSWFLLARVEVTNQEAAGAVVVFGDSISDGTRSTADTNNRWPDHLARRIAQRDGAAPLGVVNAAISGNRLMSEALPPFGINALARFEEDVLLQPGAKYVVVMEGINDIGMAPPTSAPTAEDIIAAHRQLIGRAHTWGLRIYGATLTPYEGAAYFTPQGETVRQAVNEWLRNSGSYDGVIDFDALVRDAAAPARIDPRYDSGDHLHPNDAGYAAMGNAVDLTLFAAASGTR